MPRVAKTVTPEEALQALARLFMADAQDRHVYCVFAPYPRLRPFQQRLQDEVTRGGFNNTNGKVEYISLTRDLYTHLRDTGQYDKAAKLADKRRDEQLKSTLSDAFRDLVTKRIETPGTLGLFLSDFELLYAYDLGGHNISLARQVAINGKRICVLVPGTMRDGRLWIFDEDPQSRREFPESLLFLGSGWVFELSER
jgi:hypothetical protein